MPLLATLVSAIAPKLAKHGLDALSGLFGSLGKKGVDLAQDTINQQVQKVADKIQEKTGISLDDIADDKLTDVQWQALKQFELEESQLIIGAQKHALELELQTLQAFNEDRKDARASGVSRDDNDDWFIRRFTYIFAYAITGLTFVFIFLAIFLPAHKSFNLPAESWQIMNTVVGFLLGTCFSAIVQYFYGSSMGSKNKDKDRMASIAANNTLGKGGR